MGVFVTRIQWSGPAIRELEAALDFIALDNRDAADHLAVAIYKAVSRLQRFPASGRMVPEADEPDLREVIHHPFRAINQHKDQSVEILAVVRAEQEPDFQKIQGRSV